MMRTCLQFVLLPAENYGISLLIALGLAFSALQASLLVQPSPITTNDLLQTAQMEEKVMLDRKVRSPQMWKQVAINEAAMAVVTVNFPEPREYLVCMICMLKFILCNYALAIAPLCYLYNLTLHNCLENFCLL